MSYIRKGEALFVTVLNGAYDSSAVVMVMVKVNAILDFFIGGEKKYHFHANNYFISSWLIRFLLNPCFICISKLGRIGAIVKQFYWIKTLKITDTDWSKNKNPIMITKSRAGQTRMPGSSKGCDVVVHHDCIACALPIIILF